jgi:hypothetical protein
MKKHATTKLNIYTVSSALVCGFIALWAGVVSIQKEALT